MHPNDIPARHTTRAGSQDRPAATPAPTSQLHPAGRAAIAVRRAWPLPPARPAPWLAAVAVLAASSLVVDIVTRVWASR
jgi:hypothetical protein